jgi:hypothetical protein
MADTQFAKNPQITKDESKKPHQSSVKLMNAICTH